MAQRSDPRRVLLVDDDDALRAALAALFEHAGYSVRQAANGADALDLLRREPSGVVLLDVRLGNESGLDLLPRLKALRPESTALVMTARGTIEMAVEAMRRGADNFLVKGDDPSRLLAVVEKGFESHDLRRRSERLERLAAPRIAPVLGHSPALLESVRMIEAVAARDTTVLFLGETGSGKGLLARHLHALSPRAKEPIVELNCAGLSRELTESELFGHERGAFTGAVDKKLGLFEVADGGTLLLDEIGEMEMSIQAKLLKVLEERRFRRVGGTAEISADVRLVAATHRDLEQDARDGRFRSDLFYRLNGFVVRIPSLRERTEDILPLAAHFLREFRESTPEDDRESWTDAAAARLMAYDWPGNIRELRNVMERAAILAPPDGPIREEHLPPLGGRTRPATPPPMAAATTASPATAAAPSADGAPATLKSMEKAQIERALAHRLGNIRAAAKDLGISRGTLYRKARAFGIPLGEDAEA